MSRFSPSRIAILGPGLLGGSLLMALRASLPHSELRAWARRDAGVLAVQERSLADSASTSLAEVVAGAEFIVLCTTVSSMPAIMAEVVKSPLAPGCVITDVGSVKGSVVVELEKSCAAAGYAFVGSHPMAGSERAGIEAARADLFAGQTCLITPTDTSDTVALDLVRAFWQLLGCRVVEMPAALHDRKVARISHLPHLAAAAVTLAALEDDGDAVHCVGNGFRDTTRVSAGDPDLWTGIVLENLPEVLASVQAAARRLGDLVAILENVDEVALRQYLHEAKTLRDTVPPSAP